MKRVLVMLVVGTMISGIVAACACMGGPVEAADGTGTADSVAVAATGE